MWSTWFLSLWDDCKYRKTADITYIWHAQCLSLLHTSEHNKSVESFPLVIPLYLTYAKHVGFLVAGTTAAFSLLVASLEDYSKQTSASQNFIFYTVLLTFRAVSSLFHYHRHPLTVTIFYVLIVRSKIVSLQKYTRKTFSTIFKLIFLIGS
jgi:hypothetical protein